jgi:hypothetical protein
VLEVANAVTPRSCEVRAQGMDLMRVGNTARPRSG